MKIFVGFDSTQQAAFDTCVKSIKYHSSIDIEPVNVKDLIDKQLYWRATQGSTEFSFTRFLVPHLSGYKGFAIFCDSDFIWNVDPKELFQYIDETKAVSVCKHNITPDQLTSTKMDKKPQRWYRRKNWSSLMLFNCNHTSCSTLSPFYVSVAAPGHLHEFQWCKDEEIGSLPLSYNYLAGYSLNVAERKAVHFTDGGPWHDGYENVEYSHLWHFYRGLNV